MTDKQGRYNSGLTREPFLFREMRITASLLCEGLSDEDAESHIVSDNLYQYPTTHTLSRNARACIRRLRGMQDDSLIRYIHEAPAREARQTVLYALMCDSRLVREWMIGVIGEKYRLGDYHFAVSDLRDFLMHVQEQDDSAARWSLLTVKKLRQVLLRLLVDNEYLDTRNSTVLQPVRLSPVLGCAIRESGRTPYLAAFYQFD